MNIRTSILNVLMAVCLVGFLGCQSEQEGSVEETPSPSTTSQTTPAREMDKLADAKTNAQETLQDQYSKLGQHIEILKNKVEQVPEESKEEFNQISETLQRQKAVAKERLEALAASTTGDWEQLKASAEQALADLQNTYDQMADRFL